MLPSQETENLAIEEAIVERGKWQVNKNGAAFQPPRLCYSEPDYLCPVCPPVLGACPDGAALACPTEPVECPAAE